MYLTAIFLAIFAGEQAGDLVKTLDVAQILDGSVLIVSASMATPDLPSADRGG